MNERDFEVRLLSEYSIDDLDFLFKAADSARQGARESGHHHYADVLDIWCYRIRDAIEIAEQRN